MQSSYFERNVFLHGLIIVVYGLYIEEKPTFVFESLFNSGIFDSSYPIYHILEKLIQVDKENKKRCQNESTFDWDLFLTNLLVKITAYFLHIIYHSFIDLPFFKGSIIIVCRLVVFTNCTSINLLFSFICCYGLPVLFIACSPTG